VLLALVMAMLASGIAGMFWFARVTSDKFELVRLARAQLQTLDQQFNVLQSPGIAPLIDSLQEDLDTLQIRLVEVMTQQPAPAGVVQVGYEQTLLTQLQDEAGGDSVSVLRLNLNLTVRHSIGLLDMLDRIDDSVAHWPHEIRACELQRLPLQVLSAQCVVDFYHWTVDGQQSTAQVRQLSTESLVWA
jgi:hypothetical protein